MFPIKDDNPTESRPYVTCILIGLNIFIGQTGDLNVSIKFENPDAVNQFENNYVNIISDLKESLVFKENNFVGVCAYTYEKEAASTEM